MPNKLKLKHIGRFKGYHLSKEQKEKRSKTLQKTLKYKKEMLEKGKFR